MNGKKALPKGKIIFGTAGAVIFLLFAFVLKAPPALDAAAAAAGSSGVIAMRILGITLLAVCWWIGNVLPDWLVTIVMLILYLAKKKDDDDDNNDPDKVAKAKEKEKKQGGGSGVLKLLTLIPAVIGVVLFFLTEDMTAKMRLVDNWTILMIVLLAINVVLAICSGIGGRKKDDEDDQAGEATRYV